MKRIALIHTVKSVLNTFEGRIRQTFPDETLLIHNLLDDFLASDPAVRGEFTQANLNRLHNDLKSAELTGADAVVVTCSTLTPGVKKIRPFIGVPVLSIDDAMCQKAVETGSRIHILATAQSTVEPTRSNLLYYAGKAGKELEITVQVCDEAYEAIKRLDQKTHDQVVLDAAKGIRDCDAVVLAQASMAHLEQPVADLCGIPTLSSPSLCLEQLKETLFPKG